VDKTFWFKKINRKYGNCPPPPPPQPHDSGLAPLVYQLVEQHMANNCVTVLPQHPWLQSELLIITVAYESKPYEQHTGCNMCEKIKQWCLQSFR
jgi:hypothetical protein